MKNKNVSMCIIICNSVIIVVLGPTCSKGSCMDIRYLMIADINTCNQHRPQGQQVQRSLLDAVFPLSEQSQGRFPNATLGDNYPVQGSLSDATLEQSQQLQKILPDTRCVGSHPTQRWPLTQRSQPQEMLTSDMLLLTQQAWEPLSAVAYKDTQPLQRCVHPQTLLTQGTVPCTASQ